MKPAILLVTLLALSPHPAPSQTYGPADAPVEVSDLARFWKAWDRLASATSYQDTLRSFTEEYFQPGSPGLRDFIQARIGGEAELVDRIRRHRRYYASIRPQTERIQEFIPQIREVFSRWASLVPEARFPSVYFVIGRMTSGGTTTSSRILIGAEMYGRTPDTPTEELGTWHREVLAPVERIPAIVAHEFFHTQQRYARDNRLLAKVLIEGIPDFLGELITGQNINGHVHEWAEPRSRQLWQDFQKAMNGTETAGWLYTRRAADEPNDLGYWIGYRIARAYYRNAADKSTALRDLLSIQDFDAFLAASGIAGELN